MSGQITYTPQQAADLVGCHRSKMSRWCNDGRLPGAVQTDDGWRIPLQSLIDAELYDPTAQPETPAETIHRRRTADEVGEVRAELLRLRADLASAQAELRALRDERKHLWQTVATLTTGVGRAA